MAILKAKHSDHLLIFDGEYYQLADRIQTWMYNTNNFDLSLFYRISPKRHQWRYKFGKYQEDKIYQTVTNF